VRRKELFFRFFVSATSSVGSTFSAFGHCASALIVMFRL